MQMAVKVSFLECNRRMCISDIMSRWFVWLRPSFFYSFGLVMDDFTAEICGSHMDALLNRITKSIPESAWGAGRIRTRKTTSIFSVIRRSDNCFMSLLIKHLVHPFRQSNVRYIMISIIWTRNLNWTSPSNGVRSLTSRCFKFITTSWMKRHNSNLRL